MVWQPCQMAGCPVVRGTMFGSCESKTVLHSLLRASRPASTAPRNGTDVGVRFDLLAERLIRQDRIFGRPRADEERRSGKLVVQTLQQTAQ